MSNSGKEFILREMLVAAKGISEGAVVVAGEHGANIIREWHDRLSYSETPAKPSRVLSGATSCSHGGDNELANAAGSHDSARDEERRRFWRASFDYRRQDEPRETVRDICEYADRCLEEYDKRFGAVAAPQSGSGE